MTGIIESGLITAAGVVSGPSGIPPGCYASSGQANSLVSSGDSIMASVTFNASAGQVATFAGLFEYISNNDLVAHNHHMELRDSLDGSVFFEMPSDPLFTPITQTNGGSLTLSAGFHTFSLVYDVVSTGVGQDTVIASSLKVCVS